MKKFLLFLVALGLAGAGAYWYVQASTPRGNSFRTAKVERGKFTATIGATGTVEPEVVIDVGAQVAGRIERFGRDPRYEVVPDAVRFFNPILGQVYDSLVPPKLVNYGTPVEAGTVLAQLDASLFQADVLSARADLAKAQADLQQNIAKLDYAERDMSRNELMLATKASAQADYDLARSNYLTAKATVKVSEASVEQAKAALKKAETNLGYTTIRSTVKGVVIDRRVNIGQTVVASLTAPSLFLLAKDLKKLEVWASVNEADIGVIKEGQRVTFTCEAFRDDKPFVGYVAKDQPRLNATMTSNVVTYTVVVETDNKDGRLKPYMTANMLFEVAHKDNALLVPNAALRWKPKPEQVVPGDRDWYARMLVQQKKDAAKGTSNAADKKKEDMSLVWVAEGDLVRPIKVKAGLTDGTVTEILSGDLHENMDVVIREDHSQDQGGPAGSPFTPTMFGKKKE
jgi:HlyD family secretion protein